MLLLNCQYFLMLKGQISSKMFLKKVLAFTLQSIVTFQGGEFTGVRKSDVHERQRLIQLVHLQAQEVEALKEEITLLSRKGGHILPPAQPPMPQSSADARQPVMPSAWTPWPWSHLIDLGGSTVILKGQLCDLKGLTLREIWWVHSIKRLGGECDM